METCTLSEFIQALEPWLSKDYIREAYLDSHNHFRLVFSDGVRDTYKIDDCTRSQLKDIIEKLKKRGVNIEE